MPDSETSLSEFESNDIFEDPDLTPKPLRIAKRRHLRDSGALSTLPTLSTSSTQQALVPVRRSSISTRSTQLDLSQQDSASISPPWFRRHTSLHVHKQRGSNLSTSSSTSTTSGYAAGSSISEHRGLLRDSCTHRMSEQEAKSSSTEIKTNTTIGPTATRAFTAGVFKKADFLNPVNDEPMASAPTPVIVGRRRAVTTDVSFHSDAGSPKGANDHVLRSQPSFKNRLITRMMSGLTHRTQSNQATVTDQDRSAQILTRKAVHPDSLTSDSMGALRRVSGSSTRTEPRSGSDLDDALAAFPTPPTSNESSPTNRESFTVSHSNPQRYRNLSTPEDATIVGAELRLTSEYDQLRSDSENSMLVAIDIQGILNPTLSGQSLWSHHTGLDVVVVIDNSLYTSPTMLMASCETARALASTLNVVTDRLAVLCTSPINTHRTLGSDFTTIWPLTQIKVHKLKVVLDAVVGSKEKPTISSWDNTINAATNLLLQSIVLDSDAETLQDTFGLVIVLTANAEGISSGLLTHEKLQFHVICPASVPRSDYTAIDCNGWKMRSMAGNEPQAVRPQKNPNPTSLLSRLRGLVIHARGGKDAGKLTYLSLDIKAGPGCTIDSIMGKSEYLALHPGELCTVLVKLRIRAPNAQGHPLPCTLTLPGLGPDSIDILNELDKMLSIAPRPIKVLTARLKYKHSRLPANTTCSTTAECLLKKHIPHEIGAGDSMAMRISGRTILVQERLAYHLATQGPPKRALHTFCEEFGDEGWRSSCPDYTHLIIHELKYQARIAQRVEFDLSPKKPILPLKMVMDSPISPSNHFGHGLLDTKKSRPLYQIPNHTDKSTSNSENAQLVIPSDPKKSVRPAQQRQAEINEARINWGHLRKRSKGHNSPSKGRSVSSKVEEERKRSLRALAVRGKTGIGAATLRHITSASESMERGIGGAA